MTFLLWESKLLGTGAGGHLLSAPTGSWGFILTPAIQVLSL
nr:MAG TPA: hypothetical protein [Caudoviricetes sp.]